MWRFMAIVLKTERGSKANLLDGEVRLRFEHSVYMLGYIHGLRVVVLGKNVLQNRVSIQ